MKKITALTLLGAMTMMLTACGGNPHDAAASEMVSHMEDMNSVIAGIENVEDAKAAAPKLEAIVKEMRALGDRAKKLEKATPEIEKALEEKYKPRMEKVGKEMQANMMKLAKDPAILMELGKAMQAMAGLENMGN